MAGERRGAEDARRDVARQLVRNRGAFGVPDPDVGISGVNQPISYSAMTSPTVLQAMTTTDRGTNGTRSSDTAVGAGFTYAGGLLTW